MDIFNDLVLPLAASPWVYLIALLLVVLDGICPVFPSEMVVAGLAALAASSAVPDIVLLLLTASLGAMLGDSLTYALGRLIGVRRLQSTRLRPLARLLRWASRRMGPRAGMVVLTARFIPFARLAVNLTAGSTGFPYARFAPFCFIAGVIWAAYNVTLGYLAGHWFRNHPYWALHWRSVWPWPSAWPLISSPHPPVRTSSAARLEPNIFGTTALSKRFPVTQFHQVKETKKWTGTASKAVGSSFLARPRNTGAS